MRRLRQVALAACAATLAVGVAPCLAQDRPETIATETGAQTRTGEPVTVTASGYALPGERIVLEALRDADSLACSETPFGGSSRIYDAPVSGGQYSVASSFTPEQNGRYLICGYVMLGLDPQAVTTRAITVDDGTDPIAAELTPANARAAVLEELRSAYGRAVGPRPYVACPAAAIGDAASCYYQFTRLGKTRRGSYSVTPDDGVLVAERTWFTVYSQRTYPCGHMANINLLNGLRVTGRKIAARRGECRSLTISDLHDLAVYRYPAVVRRFGASIHGTGTGSYRGIFYYPCKSTARRGHRSILYRVRCANALGDHFSYAFTIRKRP